MKPAFNIEEVASRLARLAENEQPESPAITARRAEILEVVARETVIATPALPFVETVSAIRQLRNPPTDTLDLLSQTFPADDLTSTGVAYRHGEQLQLSPVFGTPEDSFCFRYYEKNRVDAVSARGVLSGDRRELARLSSETCDSRDTPEKPCLLAFSEFDARLLQQLGFDVISARPLLSWTSDDVKHYLALRHSNQPGRKWTLVVPLWQPHALLNSAPPLALQIVQQFVKRCRFLKLDGGVLVRGWCPSTNDIKHFREASELRDGKILAAEFKKSLASSSYIPRDALTVLCDRASIDFGTALQQLEQVIGQSAEFPQIAKATPALKKLERAFKRQIVSLLLADAQTRCPWERLARMMAAQVAEDWFANLNQVNSARLIDTGSNPGEGFGDDLRLAQRSKAVDDFCKLYRLNFKRR